MKNSIRNMVLETMESLYKRGRVDEITMREVKALALEDVKPYAPKAIVKLRRKLKLSQAAFARFINTSVYTVQKWEQGVIKPSGPALKLLHIIEEKGLAGVI
ncbi:MAG: helix-turn-helix domain-containing protein [Candidatus Omnitrophica bacterium]|nr:helix-turn-helix domain-containing protein [Candidatus Omnitrophota bacterium]